MLLKTLIREWNNYKPSHIASKLNHVKTVLLDYSFIVKFLSYFSIYIANVCTSSREHNLIAFSTEVTKTRFLKRFVHASNKISPKHRHNKKNHK